MNNYYPILKGKKGEWDAVAHLPASSHAFTTPVIEIPPIQVTYEDEIGKPTGRARTIDEHIAAFQKGLLKAFPKGWEFGLDGVRALKSDQKSLRLLRELFGAARENGLAPVPVTGLDRKPRYQQAVQRIAATDNRGLIVRLTRRDFSVPTSTFRKLGDLATTFGWTYDKIKLLIDIGPIGNDSANDITQMYMSFVDGQDSIDDFRDVAIVLTSLTDDVTKDMKPFTLKEIVRDDLRAWRQISNASDCRRVPSFGDYGVNTPAYANVDFRVIKLIGKIRYSTTDHWLVARGKVIEKEDNQFHKLAGMITRHNNFNRARPSWGDKVIQDCANLMVGPGNLTSWISYTTSHHLELMPRLLASAA